MRRFRGVFLLLILLGIASVVITPMLSSSAIADVRAQDGMLDLRDLDFGRSKPVNVKGEWGFVWGKLVSPSDIHNQSTHFVEFPHMWLGSSVNGVELSGHGYGTYSLTIKISEDSLKTPKAIYLPSISSASKLWVNGQLVEQVGLVGTSREKEKPAYDPTIVVIAVNTTEINLVLQISNFSERKGGIWGELLFGEAEDIMNIVEDRLLKEMFFIGSLSIFGIYHIIIYILRRKEQSALAFGLFCLFIALRTMLVGEIMFTELFSTITWDWLKKIEYWTISLALPVFILFLGSIYPTCIKKSISAIILAISIFYSLFVLFTPAVIFTQTIYFFQVVILTTMGYVIYIFKNALKQNEPGVKILFASSIILAITVLNDILYHNELINTKDLTSIGLFIFIIAQSTTLAIKYALAFMKIETMSASLQELNHTLEDKVRTRTSELEMSQLELEKANHRLKELSNLDSLTNIPNRRLLEATYESAWSNAQSNKQLLTVMMIDVDCFKLYNDTYGHLQGDDILKAVAEVLQFDTKKNNGFLARYGGEEFFVLLEGKTIENASKIAKRLSQSIFALHLEHKTSTVSDHQVTISVGVSQLIPNEEINREQLIKQADEALYKAKEAGRNTVYYYMTEGSVEL